MVGDAGIRETVLKSTYEGIVKGARNVTEQTLPGVNLMKNFRRRALGHRPESQLHYSFHLRPTARHPSEGPHYKANERLVQA